MRAGRVNGRYGDIKRPESIATVGARHATHLSEAQRAWLGDSMGPGRTFFPVTLPLAEIIDGLNAAQPDGVSGYASALHLLADAALRGLLRISPSSVFSLGEPLLPETEARIKAAWG